MRPGSTAFANSPTENAEKTVSGFGCGSGIAWRMTVVQASARTTTESEVERDRDDDPLPLDGRERVADGAEARAAPPEERERAPHEHECERRRGRRATSAGAASSRRRGLVDLDETRGDRVPRVPLLRERRGRRRPSAARRGSSASSASTASASACSSPAGNATPVSGVMTSRYPVMSDATTGVAHASARVSTMPKLSPPSDGATSAFAASSSAVNALLVEEAEHVDAVVRHAQAAHEQPDAQRVGADDAQVRARSAAGSPATRERSTCRPLRCSWRPAKTMRCSRPRRLGGGRDQHAVRDDLVLAGEPALRRRRAPSRRRRCAGRAGRRGSPTRASRSASSRGRRSRGTCRPSGRCTSRARRCTASASSARAGGGRRSARARAPRGCGRASAG